MAVSTGPTPDWNQVVLRWAGVNLDGTPCAGTLSLTYNATVPLLDDDAVLPVSIYPVELTKTLTTATIALTDANGATVNRTVGYAEWLVPASDDPDIQGFGGTYTLVEKLANGKGQTRNFVASKDAADPIWLNRITSVTAVPGQAISAVSVAQVNQMQAQLNALIANGGGGSGGSFSGVPTDGSVTNAKVASNAAISADKLVDGTNGKIMTAAERTRLTSVANGATANSPDGTLLNRANHTGTQPASTISDFTTAVQAVGTTAVPGDGTITNVKVASNAAISADKLADGTSSKVLTAAERSRLAGMANGATANSADSVLLNRGNHTGSQTSSTISDFTEASEDTVGAMAVRSGGVYDDPNGKVTWSAAGVAFTPTGSLTATTAQAAIVQAASMGSGSGGGSSFVTWSTSTQGEITASKVAAAGIPNNSLIVVDPS